MIRLRHLGLAFLGICLVGICLGNPAFAVSFPYTTRTLPFAGWGTTVRGDIRTLGLAGATVGLADTFIASVDNPAGLAMTVGGVGAQITSNRVHDGHIQEYDQTISSNHIGGIISTYPWGFGVGFWTPHREDQTYRDPVTGERLRAEVYTRELRASMARVFFRDRLSLGATLTLGQAARILERVEPAGNEETFRSYAVGASFGAMFKLPRRWLIGVNYSLPMRYQGSSEPHTVYGISQFYQPVEVPYRLSVGVGWIPNRFFNAGFGLYFVGSNPTAALASDQTRLVGEAFTAQPRMGATYTWAEFKEFEGKIAAGAYFETSRVQGASSRMHVTGGLETNPWIFNLGWGIDVSTQYVNYIVGIGVDVIRLLRKLDIVISGYQPPRGGFLPKPFQLSDEGLARPLVKDWVDHHNPGIIDTVIAVPDRVERKLKKTRNQLLEAVTGTPGQFDEPLPDPSPRSAPSKPKKKPRPRKNSVIGAEPEDLPPGPAH